MEDKLVSIIVATYRRADELNTALDSLARQTYKNIEVVLVDDNADPEWNGRVAKTVEAFRAKCDIPIVYIANPGNMGSAASRNIGIAAAKGEYVSFLDDDDVYLPEKIERQLKDFMAADADFGLTDLKLYDKNDRLVDTRIRDYIKDSSEDELLKYHLMYHMTGTDTLMFRADYLRSIGGFPGIDVGDEFYLMLEAIKNGGSFVYSPHCYVKAYIHTGEDGGLSSGQKKIDGENALHSEKEKYFPQLDKKTVKAIKTRHYAVIAFAELRRKRFAAFAWNALRAFCNSPIQCARILMRHKDS